MKNSFIHLHLHTEYSILDSTVRIPQLIEQCIAFNMPAVAITDQCNLFGMIKFYRKALEYGIKPIIGADIHVASSNDVDRYDNLALLCMNRDGYLNLANLITRSWLEGQIAGVPRVYKSWLDHESCKGLIALSSGKKGDIGRKLNTGSYEQASDSISFWRKVFDERFYLELIRTRQANEEEIIGGSIQLAHEFSIPVVASNDVRFLKQDDYSSHEARVCIHEGRILSDSNRPSVYSKDQYFKDCNEMNELFSDISESLSNSLEIAQRCSLDLKLGKTFLPIFSASKDVTTEHKLRIDADIGLEIILDKIYEIDNKAQEKDEGLKSKYHKRLDNEINVICDMGFASYFLIVADFIQWAKDQKIPVGPGRGSGAGSLVAYVLGITNLDPIEHDLLFERFLNPERVSMPDFDIDFCMEGRDQVIEYVSERYGRDRVSQIITYGRMAAKAVIRDAGRVLNHPYGFVDSIAKLIPFDTGITLEKALGNDKELEKMYQKDDDVRSIIDLAKSLEGLVRNAGKHAGGVVIAPKKLTDFTPLYCEEGGLNIVTQFDKDDVESAGLVKFDFLGLRTLTIIHWAIQNINKYSDKVIDINNISIKDDKTFKFLKSGNTTAVFQLESRGMRRLIKRLKPDHFDDLVALVALFRPGPLQSGMVDDFISRKNDVNKDDIDYFHPNLRSILESSYGVILYQEQVMQIAQTLAGYTLGGADLLRRAMGKKKHDEMAEQREIFVKGSCERGVSTRTATRIFDLMEKFAGYGFNKSHSVAYALLSYQTAYLKTHYTDAFLAAVMSAEIENTDRLVMLKDDCRKFDIFIEPPDINRSTYFFSLSKKKTILYGLGAIKGVGRNSVEAIISEREKNGPYINLGDFCKRINLEKINRRAIEAIIKGGAFDQLGICRQGVMSQLISSLHSAQQEDYDQASGQDDMFGVDDLKIKNNDIHIQATEEWNESDLLKFEKEALGLYLTGHPFNAVRQDASHFIDSRITDILSEPPPLEKGYRQLQRNVIIAGLISDIKKRGNRVILMVDDDTGYIEVVLFNEVFYEYKDILNKDEIIVVDGSLRYDDFASSWQINANNVIKVDKIIEKKASSMMLVLSSETQSSNLLSKLHDLLYLYRDGDCEVSIQYADNDISTHMELSSEWSVRPCYELREKLSELLGEDAIRLFYSLDTRLT